MPRLALQDYETIICSKKGVLEEYMLMRRADDIYMANKLGISKQSFQYKRKDPGKFTGKELAKINIILQIPEEKRI
ncbi:MAG: hypothetical protein PHD70_14235 [Anaerostipes sp.]|nr:hypothetical protein [Anaerostipes sp.]MDD4372264.1 hypothetical protein [Anaerostipes sp.]